MSIFVNPLNHAEIATLEEAYNTIHSMPQELERDATDFKKNTSTSASLPSAILEETNFYKSRNAD